MTLPRLVELTAWQNTDTYEQSWYVKDKLSNQTIYSPINLDESRAACELWLSDRNYSKIENSFCLYVLEIK